LLLSFTNTITTTSVTRSESECTASAIMADERPIIPKANFKATSSRFTTLPSTVTR